VIFILFYFILLKVLVSL